MCVPVLVPAAANGCAGCEAYPGSTNERASIASFLLKEGKPEEASLATLTGPAVDVITYDEDEEPDTDVDENIDEDYCRTSIAAPERLVTCYSHLL